MSKTFRGPPVQLAFRLRKIKRRRGECKKPWKEAGKMFEVPGELSIFKIRYVEELPCGGKEEKVPNDA
jgi:hypothetical protein